RRAWVVVVAHEAERDDAHAVRVDGKGRVAEVGARRAGEAFIGEARPALAGKPNREPLNARFVLALHLDGGVEGAVQHATGVRDLLHARVVGVDRLALHLVVRRLDGDSEAPAAEQRGRDAHLYGRVVEAVGQ